MRAQSTVRPTFTSCGCNKPLPMDGRREISNLTPPRLASGEQIPHVLQRLSVPWQHVCHYIFVYNLDWSEMMLGTIHCSSLLAFPFFNDLLKQKMIYWFFFSYLLSCILQSLCPLELQSQHATQQHSCGALFLLSHFIHTRSEFTLCVDSECCSQLLGFFVCLFSVVFFNTCTH